MMYGSWDIKPRQTEVFVILGHVLPFDPPNNPKKTKILKNWKEHLETLSFYTCGQQMTTWCMVPEIWSATDRIFSHFGPFFALLPS